MGVGPQQTPQFVNITSGSANIPMAYTYGYTVGQAIYSPVTIGTAGGQMVAGTVYYVVTVTANTSIQVSATPGGSAITFNATASTTLENIFLKANLPLPTPNGGEIAPGAVAYAADTDSLYFYDAKVWSQLVDARGLEVKEGSNAKQGTSTLVAGTVTVSNTSVTTSSRIFLCAQSLGTVTVPKALGVTARTAGTSFTITSADATDTSVVAWEIFEPAV
jgi:hypothetical protein